MKEEISKKKKKKKKTLSKDINSNNIPDNRFSFNMSVVVFPACRQIMPLFVTRVG